MATRNSSRVTPFQVAPPLSPLQAVAQGAAYSENVWRGGLPNPFGQARGAGVVGVSGPIGPSPSPLPAGPTPLGPPERATPLAERLSEAMMEDCFGSGGAFGDSSALWFGCWIGGRSVDGRTKTARSDASAR